MQTLIVFLVAVCLFLWASDWLRKPPSVMSDIFLTAWIVLLFVTATN